MAEAVVVMDEEEVPPAPAATKFFCHSCNVEIESVSEEYTCLLCGKGFIEEIAVTPATEPSADATIYPDPDMDMHDSQNVFHTFMPQSFNSRLTEEISSLLMSVTGTQPHQGAGGTGRFPGGSGHSTFASPRVYIDVVPHMPAASPAPPAHQQLVNNHHHSHAHPVASSSGGGGGGGRGASGSGTNRGTLTWGVNSRPMARRLSGTSSTSRGGPLAPTTDMHHLDNIVQEFLISVTGGVGGVAATASPMYFMSNPADYVYGRDGLDTIVTQLLNQMDGTGPAPLAANKIEEIPHVEVTAEQVAEKLQCAVCWDDFILAERVRKLPCVHIFHENCIVPWLNLHATCPVCRQVLSSDNPDEQQQAVVNDVTQSLRSVAAMYQNPERSDTTSAPASTTAGTGNRRISIRNPPRRYARYTADRLGSTADLSLYTQIPQLPHLSAAARAQTLRASTVAQSTRNQSEPDTRSRRDEDGNVDYDYD